MDVLYPNYIQQHQFDSRHPELENYSELIKQLSQPTDLSNGHLPDRNLALHTPPTASAIAHGSSKRTSSSTLHRHTSSQSTPQSYQQGRGGIMDRRSSQHTQPASSFLQVSHDDDEDFNVAFSNMAQQSSSQFGPSLSALYGLQQPEISANDHIWHASVDEAARFSIGDTQTLATLLSANSGLHNNAAFDMSAYTGADMDSRAAVDHDSEAAALEDMQRMMNGGQRRIDSTDEEPFGAADQALIAQPMAMHGSNMNQPSHISQLHAEAERMVQSPPQYASDAGLSFSQAGASPESMQQTFSQTSNEQSTQSPHSLADQDQHELAFQDSRRPSGATELANNIQNVHLHPSQSTEELQFAGSFKRPSIPLGGSSTLAARRKQQGPHGINVQRHPGAISRAFSSSAINQLNSAARATPTPNGTLRRNKSSNIVLSGRVAKSGNNSARNSPMLASFNESATMSAQVTPQPGSASMQAQASLAPPSPRNPMYETQLEMMPSSASTAAFTPGIYSNGSMGHRSYQNTPMTTPSGFNQQPPQFKAPDWMPPSDVPQSAPAHMMSFPPRDMSPTQVMPSMPPTPANMQFPHPHPQMPTQMQLQMQMHHGQMVQPHMPIVPSQHGVPEGYPYIPAHEHEMLQYAHQQGIFHEARDDMYAQQAAYFAQFGYPPPQSKPMDFKLDAGVDKLHQEVSEGRAKLLPVTKADFTFNNLYIGDMKKQQDKS